MAMKIIAFLLISILIGRGTPPPADVVVKAACQKAKEENKKVFLIFHASWCGWCHRMDSIMNAPTCKPLFNKNYVIEHLDIMEVGEKKALENPGAIDLYNKYTGKNDGIPFYLIMDGDGNVLQDSKIKSTGANVGCPDKPEELACFREQLKATSTLSDGEIETIVGQFKRR
jgi:thioredoxin-related protein